MGSAGFVATDVICQQCSYNLRGLPQNGKCPECGLPVVASVDQRMLQVADPCWVRRLARGTLLILFGVVVFIATPFGVVGADLWFGEMMQKVAIGSLLPLGWLLVTVGSWFLSTANPNCMGDRYGLTRIAIRLVLPIGLVCPLIGVMTLEWGWAFFCQVRVVQALFGVGILLGPGLVAQLYYLRELARRIPDAALAGRATFLMYYVGAAFGVLFVCGAIFALEGMRGIPLSSIYRSIVVVVWLFDYLAIVIAGVLWMFLLWRMRIRLIQPCVYAGCDSATPKQLPPPS